MIVIEKYNISCKRPQVNYLPLILMKKQNFSVVQFSCCTCRTFSSTISDLVLKKLLPERFGKISSFYIDEWEASAMLLISFIHRILFKQLNLIALQSIYSLIITSDFSLSFLIQYLSTINTYIFSRFETSL